MSKMYSARTKNNEQLNIVITKKDQNCYNVGFSFFSTKKDKSIHYIEAFSHIFTNEYMGVRATLRRAEKYLDEIQLENVNELIKEVQQQYLDDNPFRQMNLI